MPVLGLFHINLYIFTYAVILLIKKLEASKRNLNMQREWFTVIRCENHLYCFAIVKLTTVDDIKITIRRKCFWNTNLSVWPINIKSESFFVLAFKSKKFSC